MVSRPPIFPYSAEEAQRTWGSLQPPNCTPLPSGLGTTRWRRRDGAIIEVFHHGGRFRVPHPGERPDGAPVLPEYHVRMPDGRTVHVPDLSGTLPPEGRDVFITDNPSMESAMDHSGNYEPPFAPATQKGSTCVCVCCGASHTANHEISQFPFRYIPKSWSVNASNRAIRCRSCVDRDKMEPTFVNQNDVWVDYPRDDNFHGETTAVKISVRAHAQPRVVPVEPVAEPVNTEELVAMVQEAVAEAEEIDMSENEEIETSTPRRRLRARPKTRPQDESRTGRLKDQAKQVGGAVGAGLALAAANEAGEVFVDIAKELTSELPLAQAALAHPDGREVAKVLVALMLHTATEQTDVIPQGELIGHACKLQMTASTFTLVGPRLNTVRKHLTKLAKIGAQTSGETEHLAAGFDEDEQYEQMQAELADLRAQLAAIHAERDEEPEEEEVEVKASTKRTRRQRQ